MRYLEPSRRVGQDKGIADLVEWLDTPERYERWDLLTEKELQTIQQEVVFCRAHFTYAARNYFKIVDKRRREKLFTLWESQELILERLQWLQDMGRPGKLLVVKARQLGCSLLIELMIAWKTMFFENTTGLVVSFDPDHSAYLFYLMQYVYDRMPWWMKPMCSSREIKNGLVFENPDYDSRRTNPGLNSRISVQSANKITGVGQGMRVNCAHLSEVADWLDAAEVIEGDLAHAIVEDAETFAIMETTAKGSGTYFHRLWLKNKEMGDESEWHPLFIPWFFERTRVLAPPNGWRPKTEEVQMASQVELEWLRCSNPKCEQFHERMYRNRDRADTPCPTCKEGFLVGYRLSPAQLFWRQVKRENAAKEDKTAKLLKQEMATTDTEAFVSGGYAVFPEACLDFVNLTVREPKLKGHFDRNDRFHAIDPRTFQCCLAGCDLDHAADSNSVWIWEVPDQTSEYVVGADVGEGLGGDMDYSVACVIRVGKGGSPDRQVAKFRSNTTDPIEYAYILKSLGKWYNTAMMAVELNKYDTTASTLRFNLQYPNIYRWKHLDSTNIYSNKFGWVTNGVTKPRLYQNMIRWLKAQMFVVRSKNCAEEIKSFQKEDLTSRSAEAGVGAYDDELMATMIALYCAHEAEYDENLGYTPFARKVTMDNAAWIMRCTYCNEKWGQETPNERMNCPKCNSIRIEGNKNQSAYNREETKEDVTGELFSDPELNPGIRDYSLL